MPVVVSDTSPLRALAHLDHLDWLRVLFGQVLVPPAVVDELQFPPDRFLPVDLQQLPFLVVTTPHDLGRVDELRRSLDLGEAEALALAEEVGAELVLIDEVVGRAAATRAGFNIMGTLGILLRAKSNGWCDAVKPLLDQLQSELNFFIAPELRSLILIQAGE